MFWGKRREFTSAEYEQIQKRFTDFEQHFSRIDSQLANIRLDVDNLRGRFSRQLKGLAPVKEETETNIKPSILLRPDGTPI